MVRNWEIIRALLLKLEASEAPNARVSARDLPPYDEQEVAYHIRLLRQAGRIDAKVMESRTGDGKIASAVAISLTDSGHDLLDTIRNDKVWAKIKAHFKEKGVDMTIDLVVSVGKKIVESMLS